MVLKRILFSIAVTIIPLYSVLAASPGLCFEREPSRAVQVPPIGSELDRSAFYKAMEGDSKPLVAAQLNALQSAPENLKPAFMGSMLMKRASFSGSADSKLRYFKEGHAMLEGAIKKNPDNVEFRFLRLMIQEHAPGVLGYKANIESDCECIRKNFKSLAKEVQQAIADYNKKSRFLKLDVS